MNKEQYIKLQEKLYDEISTVLKENKIRNIVYRVIDRGLLFTPNYNEIKDRKYTVNINPWLSEIYWIRNDVFEEMLFCMGYYQVHEKYDLEGIRKGNIHLYAERYLKLAIYDLFSIREKIAYLIYEVFNRRIKIGYRKNDKMSFKNIIKGLKQIDLIQQNITWISQDEFNIIKEVLNNNFDCKICNKIFNGIRHPFTHRSNPGIGCIPLESFEFKEPDEKLSKMLLEFDKGLGIENAENRKYIIKCATMLEKKYEFEDVLNDIVHIWSLYVEGLSVLLTKINIIKNEIEDLKVI